MEESTLQSVMREATGLTPDEQLRLAAHLIERARYGYATPHRPANWKDLRGLARMPLAGQDAQCWVSTTRREADVSRERQRKPSS